MFLKNDGTVWACGRNNNGQLGDGTISNKTTPVQISSLTNITAIVGGFEHSLFLKDDGTVWTCGRNNFGQLGDGTTISRTTPVQVSNLTSITAIAIGATYHSLFLKNDGTVWASGRNSEGQLGKGDTVNRISPVQVNGLTDITSIAAGGYHSLFLKDDGTVWSCGANWHGQLGDGTIIDRATPVQAIGLCVIKGTQGVHGNIFLELNQDCKQDIGERSLAGRRAVINPGNIIVETNAGGTWYLDSLPAGTYTITADTSGKWQSTCPVTQSFTITNPDTFNLAPSFGFISTEPCPEPEVSVNMPFMRPGFSNQTLYVTACNGNLGTETLNDPYVELELDPLLIPQSASVSYTDLGNNIYRFDLDTLNPGQCASFTVACSLSVDATLGETLCMEAALFPADSCVLDTIPDTGGSPCTGDWDKSSLAVEGQCLNDDSIRFVIYNTGGPGEGDMQCFSHVRLYIDGQIQWLDSVRINGGDSVVYAFAGDGRTWRLEADQHPLHPGNSHPNATIEACGDNANWTSNLVNILPHDDADPVVDIYCGVVTGSYDPNDKRGFPLGVGDEHNIMPNQQLEYMIRFQNTGTDTAFTVVIRDTLDTDLDIFSVRSGTASDEYTFRMYGPRILEWTFDNILLPDSNTNEPESHGFVTFKVDQNKNLPNGTTIENRAGIYFDFNDPIITNTSLHTIDDGIRKVTGVREAATYDDQFVIKAYPNPFSTSTTIIVNGISLNAAKRLQLKVYDVTGRSVDASTTLRLRSGQALSMTTNDSAEIELKDDKLKNGIYIYKVFSGSEMIGTGKVVLMK